MWTPYAPFCVSCGRLIPTNASTCPHCRDDIRDKQVYFGLKDAQEQAIVDRLITESTKKKSWIMKGLLRISRMSQRVEKTLGTVNRCLNAFAERLALTLKEGVFIITLTSIFAFLSFIGYNRVELAKLYTIDILIFHYGFPLEWLQVKVNPHPSHVFDVGILWASLLLNIMLYFFMSFALVYGATKLRR
jgi:hypothetical protein